MNHYGVLFALIIPILTHFPAAIMLSSGDSFGHYLLSLDQPLDAYALCSGHLFWDYGSSNVCVNFALHPAFVLDAAALRSSQRPYRIHSNTSSRDHLSSP